MSLANTAIKNANPGTRPVKMADSGGLYLLLSPSKIRMEATTGRGDGREVAASTKWASSRGPVQRCFQGHPQPLHDGGSQIRTHSTASKYGRMMLATRQIFA